MKNILHHALLCASVVCFLASCSTKEKEEPAKLVGSPGDGSLAMAVGPSCCVDSTNSYPESLRSAMTFSKSNSCATDVDVEMRNLADSTERFTLTFKKDGVLTPPDGEANAIIMLPVGAHSTLTKTFQFSGEGQYMITTEVKLKTGPGVFTLLNHVDSPEEPSVIGTLTDTSMIILTPKAWYLTLAGGTLAEEDIKVCRKEFGFSLYGMTLMPFSASTISSSSTSMAKKAPTPSSPPKK